MAKLWEKTYTLHGLMEAFTVGEDPALDSRLVNADCVASMAHAAMLRKIGILSGTEHEALHAELARIIDRNGRGEFAISKSDEDVHTAIENHLVAALGNAGKKIHTGRSRNDQVLAALRLWSRGFLFAFHAAGLALAGRLLPAQRGTLYLYLGQRAMDAQDPVLAARYYEQAFELVPDPETGVLAAETCLLARDVEGARRMVAQARVTGSPSATSLEILQGLDSLIASRDASSRAAAPAPR